MADDGGPPALLALEDGTVFRGSAFGAEGESFGEAVFNTGMAGYQEVLTDPSYARQIVTMTAPQQGNYGMNDEDAESWRVQVAGFAVREASRRASSWRAEATLADALRDAGVVAIEGIDTRALTVRLRTAGAMRAGVSTVDLDPASLVERVRAADGMAGADLARTVSTPAAYEASDLVGAPDASAGRIFRVAAYDFGMKRNILRRLAACGIATTVFPAETPAATIAAGGYDGVFLSNGPGDPAVTTYGIAATRELLGKVPGLRDLPRAPAPRARARRADLQDAVRAPRREPAGARPRDRASWRSRATTTASPSTRPRGSATPTDCASTDYGRVSLSHWNLNDGTLEGMRCVDVPAFAVQYHPEAAPGPHDARYLFDEFRAAMGGRA